MQRIQMRYNHSYRLCTFILVILTLTKNVNKIILLSNNSILLFEYFYVFIVTSLEKYQKLFNKNAIK
jgi:hypothetical protein